MFNGDSTELLEQEEPRWLYIPESVALVMTAGKLGSADIVDQRAYKGSLCDSTFSAYGTPVPGESIWWPNILQDQRRCCQANFGLALELTNHFIGYRKFPTASSGPSGGELDPTPWWEECQMITAIFKAVLFFGILKCASKY